MDPVLSSLFPVHKIGSDGFNWWVGQIESKKGEDPKNSGRYRVRIIGQHLKDCNAVPSDKLPWANVMMPVTTPFSDGGVTGASVSLDIGNWVIGFYLDNDRQKPIILGSIGHTAGATLLKSVEKDPNPGENCKSFTTFLAPERDPYKHDPLPEKQKTNGDNTKDNSETTNVGQAGQIAAAVTGKQPAIFLALFSEATSTNPIGSKVCVEIANPNCGSEQDLKNGLKNIIGDMLAANQQAGGQLGTYLVSQVNGTLTGYVDVGRTYINKAIRLVKSFLSRIKGEIVKLIKDGVDKLIDLLLYKDQVVGSTGPVAPDLGIQPFQPIKVKVPILKTIIDKIQDILSEIGCSIEDLTDRISQYLTDLLLGYLMDAYQAAACLVDTLVDGIINQILSFIDTTLASILGPLEDLLSIVADPGNIIGAVAKKVLDILGISCDGANTKCESVTKECTDCGTDEKGDWLDELLEKLEDGPLDSTSYVCEEAKEQPSTKTTNIIFVGGIPVDTPSVNTVLPTDPNYNSTEGGGAVSLSNIIKYTCSDVTVTEGEDAVFVITRSGNVTVSSSINVAVRSGKAIFNEDFSPKFEGSSIGFAPYETVKQISFRTFRDNTDDGPEDFRIKLTSRVTPDGIIPVFPNGTVFFCTINDYTFKNVSPDDPDKIFKTVPYVPPSNVSVESSLRQPSAPVKNILPKIPSYIISPERDYYYEGEKAIFNIVSRNVSPGTIVNYTIGLVDPTDIVGGELTGSFKVKDDGTSTVSIDLAVNNDTQKIDPPGTIPQVDPETGEYILDEDGNILFNTEEIITDVPDENETLTLTIDDTNNSASITIVGENPQTPEYFISADKNIVVEGETVVFTITTANVEDETVLSYTLSGDIIKEDIEGQKLTGTFEIVDGRSTVLITIANDSIIDDVKVLTFSIDGENVEESVIVAADVVTEEFVEDPVVSVSADKLEYSEGEVIEYTISTQNVSDGTVLQYTLYGSNINASDIVNGVTFGNFVVLNGTAKVYVGIEDDAVIEDNETLSFFITGTNAFTDVIILAQQEDRDEPPPKEKDPCLTKPIAGEPITDSKGSIISIPIIEKGCPYQKEPKVIITGAGYGSSAIALLDDTGRVSEIRVTRTGVGYKLNTPTDKDLTCVIDSFTLISPGRGYTEEPDVYINGVPNLARAKVDEQGYVYSVEILDRSVSYTSLPSVLIIGGGGSGARFIPNITCLDSIEELERNGYAKIGTGKYIDCP